MSCTSCNRRVVTRRELRASLPDQLRVLRGWARRYDSIRLEFLNGDDRLTVESSLERDYLACGCAAGRWTFVVTLAVLCLAGMFFRQEAVDQPVPLALAGIGILAISTLLSMLLSIGLARRRVFHAIEKLEASMEPRAYNHEY